MKRFITLLFFLTAFLVTTSAQASIQKAQAMFIYNFSRLIEWPGAASGDFVIGVLGSPDLTKHLQDYTAGKKAGAQPISIQEYSDVSGIGNCQILFVAYGKTRNLPDVQAKVGSQPTVIISEKRGAIDEGAALNFLIVGNSLKFEIKPSNATSKGIKLSSKLQEMAAKVY